ncbi:MAG: 1-deoxy-D-xylulose-5-phosphate reductoisomerase [Clostridium sp.]|nr:1-deoxy-D-xylulose-5-phosphate reductoisomerase [Clostridium sp.]
MKKLAIIGASGSIGTQTLEVLKKEEQWSLVGVSVHRNIEKLKEIILVFNPKLVVVTNEESIQEAKEMLKEINYTGEVDFLEEGLIRLATMKEVDMVVTSLVGMVGLKPTVEAIKSGKDIALANKETLVAAGEIVMNLAKEYGVRILPVDSEHSAIFQSLQGSQPSEVKNLILTASGGPFLGRTREDLKKVTREMALKHPNWVMGPKITVDSSTLMNKGLEVIEARWLFDVNYDNIKVYVHPESVIHSMVEFQDNSVIAQLGAPDMRLPIQYALKYPHRHKAVANPIELLAMKNVTFLKHDVETFRALELAYRAGKRGGLQSAVMNSANEEAVALFLEEKISYLNIVDMVEKAMDYFRDAGEITLDKVFEIDPLVRTFVREKNKEV